jgi:hypothetical protein
MVHLGAVAGGDLGRVVGRAGIDEYDLIHKGAQTGKTGVQRVRVIATDDASRNERQSPARHEGVLANVISTDVPKALSNFTLDRRNAAMVVKKIARLRRP